MANMTNDVDRPVRMPPGGIETRKLKLAGYTNYGGGSTAFTVYKGAVVICDVTDTDGYFSNFNSSLSAASGDIFGGIALEQQKVTASDTADGSVEVTVAVNGVWAFPKGGLAITDLAAVIYADDDGTVTATSTNNLPIGILVDVDSTYAWIDIKDYAGKTF